MLTLKFIPLGEFVIKICISCWFLLFSNCIQCSHCTKCTSIKVFLNKVCHVGTVAKVLVGIADVYRHNRNDTLTSTSHHQAPHMEKHNLILQCSHLCQRGTLIQKQSRIFQCIVLMLLLFYSLYSFTTCTCIHTFQVLHIVLVHVYFKSKCSAGFSPIS